MLIAVGCLTLVALVALVALVLLVRAHMDAQTQWAQERRELLTRIQKPEYAPISVDRDMVVPEPEPDEYNLVGTINRDPMLGE